MTIPVAAVANEELNDPESLYGSTATPVRKHEGTTTMQKSGTRTVVFRSKASYSGVLWAIIAFTIAVNFVCIIPIFMDPTMSGKDKKNVLFALLGSVGFTILVFVLVLPTSFEVRSDASIGVSTLFFTYTFTNAVRAYKLESLADGAFRPRIKFATSIVDRVCVRRQGRHWDLIVSPQDANGFVQTVNEVRSELEGEEEKRQFVVPGTTI